MWKPKLRCPKCGGKGRPRKHYEKEQCVCLKCGYTGRRWEFEKKPSVRRRAGEGEKPTTERPKRIGKLLIFFIWRLPVMEFRLWRDYLKWDREMRKFMRDLKRGKSNDH